MKFRGLLPIASGVALASVSVATFNLVPTRAHPGRPQRTSSAPVRAAVVGQHVQNHYVISDPLGFSLIHYTASCARSRYSCPTYLVSVRPNGAGSTLTFTLQRRQGGSWVTVWTTTRKVFSSSWVRVMLPYNGESIKDLPQRIGARFNGSGTILPAVSDWSYFKITS
jgi:hypothetical protein